MEVLRERWGLPRLEVHAALASTNDRLRELARAGAAPWTVVVADTQRAGRGRGGSAWHSPPGVGLWMSVLLPSARGMEGPPLAPILAGVAVSRAVRELVSGARPRIKWPNDVYLEGRKVCGILCEDADGRGIVAGIGVNVGQTPDDFPPALRGRAGSLRMASGRELSRRELTAGLLAQLRELCAPEPRALDGSLSREIEALDLLRGRPVRTDGGVVGRAAGIAGDGSLVVETAAGGTRRLVAGGVRLLETGGEGSGGSERGERGGRECSS